MMFDWKAPGFAGGDKNGALAIVQRLKAAHPVWGYLAEAKLMEDQDERRTQIALEQAARLGPSFYLAQASLAEFYAKNNIEIPEAERLALRCIELDPDRAAGYSVLARVYASEQRWSDLDQTLARSVARCPDDLSPYYFAARTLASRGFDPNRAAQYARKYLSQAPEGRAPETEQAGVLLASLSHSQTPGADRHSADTAARSGF